MKTVDNESNQTQCTMANDRLYSSHGQGVAAAAILVVVYLKTTKERQALYENRVSWVQLILFCK
jgi:hypothetical protein